MHPSDVQLVTVWAPRPEHPKFRDYMKLLALQKKVVEYFGHTHLTMIDRPLPEVEREFKTAYFESSTSLMRAILEGQLAYVTNVWNGDKPLVLVDIDCMPMRDLRLAFKGNWEIGLTRRINAVAPIQNGAMYFKPGARRAAIALFTKALAICEDHWGGDQEAISKVVGPVPDKCGVESRLGIGIHFLSTDTHNYSPKIYTTFPKGTRFMAHFKGETKSIAAEYCRRWILSGLTR